MKESFLTDIVSSQQASELVSRVIRERRSIKPEHFSGEEVSRQEVMLMLENAHWAPNHGKTEPWFFKVYAGDSRETLGKMHSDLYKKYTPEERFKQKSYEKLMNLPLLSSHVIVICMKRGNKSNIPVIEEVEAVACAVQNMHLTATALGLVGYWSSGGMTYHESMRKNLGLGEEDQCLGFFYLGKPKEGLSVEGKRFADVGDKIEWIEE